MIKFWDYLRFYKKNKKEIKKILDKSISSGQLILGKEVEKFEYNFAKYIGAKYAVAVGNCTDAILIALKVLNIKKNSEILTVANTAVPTIISIVNAGFTPVFVDIGDDYLINEKKIERLITKKTKAILPVHLYGQSCNMIEINKLAKKYNLKIIEDCAQATGAKFDKKFVGNFGDIGCFSFYPTKVLGGFGDGGILTTSNYKIYKKIKIFRFMGIDTTKKPSFAISDGINSRMDDMQASILNFKLKKLNYYINKRNQIAKFYNKNLDKSKFTIPQVNPKNKHVFYEYVVCANNRKKLLKNIKKNNINLKITYPHLIHKMKFFAKFKKYDLKNTEKLSKRIFSLPTFPELTKNELDKIVKTLNRISYE
jgi:dTDP-3-amino-2,3,6-trideoxy-4-keto-D-glucose/dTDP-3-amino-3,4,6-trideoxy-alpha-D-glucose/dTDP-2,6-dideoxy-D-kanosamine transaminase